MFTEFSQVLLCGIDLHRTGTLCATKGVAPWCRLKRRFNRFNALPLADVISDLSSRSTESPNVLNNHVNLLLDRV